MKAHVSEVVFSEDTKKRGSELHALKLQLRNKSNISKREEIRQKIIDFLNKTSMTEMKAISAYMRFLDPDMTVADFKAFIEANN